MNHYEKYVEVVASGPVTVEQISAETGINPQIVRVHMTVLTQAGVFARQRTEKVEKKRGQPPYVYTMPERRGRKGGKVS